MIKYNVVIPAGGSGQRMQTASADQSESGISQHTPKQFTQLAGKYVIEHALQVFMQDPDCDKIVIAVPDLKADLGIASFAKEQVNLVQGGRTRAHSVLNALMELNRDRAENSWVMVHDAARPNIHFSDIQKLKASVKDEAYGGILACPSRNTLKQVNNGCVSKTLDRDTIWQALTPQMFRLKKLITGLSLALKEGLAISDESSAMEYLGARVIIVDGRADNLKLTYPSDLPILEKLIKERNSL